MKDKIDIRSFFTNSETVWTSENFQNLILRTYVPSENNTQDKPLKGSDLQDLGSKINIQEFVFKDVDIFLEQLAGLIQDQMQGEEGKLLNDSSANYFFLQGRDGRYYSILVRWEQAQKLWRCGAYLQEELKMPSVRVFSPE